MQQPGEICERTAKVCMTFTEAHDAAKRARRKRRRAMQHYRCDACGCWHTGQRPV